MAPVATGRRRLLDPSPGDIAIGGHRGMGMNLWESGRIAPSFRENSLPSFQRAAQHGCAFVEFDVQVTKDGVPVIWHDNILATSDESDTDGYSPPAPKLRCISEFTADTFLELGRAAGSSSCSSTCSSSRPMVVKRFDEPSKSKARDDWQAWECEIEGGFARLEDVFRELPEEVGFDIEVKLATPDDLAHTPYMEIDRMLQPIVASVRDLAARYSPRRALVYSSFDPDVCLELARRQSDIPVLLLTTGGGGGHGLHADPRRNSLGAAVQLASDHRLAGVVVDAAVLRAEPAQAAAAAGAGLMLMTYGLANNDAGWVREQAALGVHAAIVDAVPQVLDRLRAPAAEALSRWAAEASAASSSGGAMSDSDADSSGVFPEAPLSPRGMALAALASA